MIDEVTLYVIKSWSLFIAILLPFSAGLFFLVDMLFNFIDKIRENRKNKK